VRTYQNYINGRFADASTRGVIDVFSPASEERISTVADSSVEDVNEAVEAAARAQIKWERLPAVQRAAHLRRVAVGIRNRADHIARVISEEQGKPLGLAAVEVGFAAEYIDYMAEWARRIEGEIVTSDRPNENIFVFRKPIGVVAGISAWNFPFFLAVRKMAPALVTGNTIVIKPSDQTPNNTVELGKVVAEAELPPGVVNVVTGSGSTCGKTLTQHPKVGLITFTGSVETGARIMAAAAANVTKVNLELGGKAPAIVLEDADLDLAAEAIKASRVTNTGQICNCAERIYVDRKIADRFTEKLCATIRKTTYGDPLKEPSIDMGPLMNRRELDRVADMVERAVADGARVLVGGHRGNRPKGFYYEATVLADCRHDMEIVQTEIFGPVVPIVVIDGLDQAIEYANDSELGLTSSLYTRNLDWAMRACNELHFGETYVNRENFEALQGFHAGWRKSGIGGADGRHGLYEFMNTHVVYLQHKGAAG
jgi:lactaldehyde dehydrogenase / glycolaldehyde dehydrogenase